MCSLFSLSMVINTFQLVVIGNQYPKKSVDSTTQIYMEVTRPLYAPTNKQKKWLGYTRLCHDMLLHYYDSGQANYICNCNHY